jgi:hypothetical protein
MGKHPSAAICASANLFIHEKLIMCVRAGQVLNVDTVPVLRESIKCVQSLQSYQRGAGKLNFEGKALKKYCRRLLFAENLLRGKEPFAVHTVEI